MIEIRAGDLCSVADGDVFKVAKVLHVDDDAVHVRLYAEQFLSRPVAVDAAELTLGSVDEQAFGIGHLPLAPEEFERWQPVVIANAPVEADELEGYQLWTEAGGGVWGAPPPSLFDRVRSLFRR